METLTAADKPSQDHTSDQEETKDEESLSEVNWRADWLEFIREFQEIMNKAIEQLLNKPARRYSHQKEKPEPCMEQGKCKETICKEAERLPQYDVNRDSDDKWNSIVLQEMIVVINRERQLWIIIIIYIKKEKKTKNKLWISSYQDIHNAYTIPASTLPNT